MEQKTTNYYTRPYSKIVNEKNQIIHSMDRLKKAFDSVSHSWMIKCMQLYKINPQIIKLIEKAMELWNTTIILQHSEGKFEILGVKMHCGIFQGDSHSSCFAWPWTN